MYINPIEQIIELLTYQGCVICQRASGPLCFQCYSSLLGDQISRCYKCNKLTKGHATCQSCRSRLRRVWWVSDYGSTTKKLIASIKLNRNRALARQLGVYSTDILPYLPENTVVCPVPTATRRVRKRGFDQADLLAQALARTKELSFATLLRRIGSADQIGKRRSERFTQMQSSFRINNAKQVPKNVLLVDDVLTTGATLEAAATVLRNAGVTHVDALVIARHMIK